MDSCTIQLTGGAISNNNLNIHACGLNFFPKGIVGGSTGKKAGLQVTIEAPGVPKPFVTDIPSDKKTGRPRWFLRDRTSVRRFYQSNNLIPGDKVIIRRISNKKYELIPHLRKLKFIDLFADFLFILHVS